MSEELINLEINGVPLQGRKGAMVIEVADAAGITIPRFCYHKKLSVAANCRMCLVEVEKAPKPLPACATPITEGMKVFTESDFARNAQKSVMEFLLINHPLDCPICDQGGECELQDVAMGYGRDVSRFQERKRVVRDKDIGPLVATDMTRCIHCTRCVRFGEEIAGMRELGATGRGESMEIGTFIARSMDSELSGNVIDLCPVGALTSKPFRFRARAWEMQQRSGLAAHDCVVSNLDVHLRRGRAMRVVPRENESVNEVWIADRDRFSYEGLYAEDRLLSPMVKRRDTWEEVDWEEALDFAVAGLRKVVQAHGAGQVGALASPTSTLEELYLLQKLMRGTGSPNVDHRLRQTDFRDDATAPLAPVIGDGLPALERAGAALLVGSNLRLDQPLVNHRLRKAALAGAAVSVVNPVDYGFNYPIANTLVVNPRDMVTALAGVARAAGEKGLPKWVKGCESGEAHAAIARSLADADDAVVLVGLGADAHPEAAAIRALAAHVAECTGARLGLLTAGGNGAGAWLAGAVPHRGPAGEAAAETGLDAAAMLDAGLRGYLLLGVEPEIDCANGPAAASAMAGAEFVVSLTAFRTPQTDAYADVLLPISPFLETAGTYVNVAGAWQSGAAAVSPVGASRPAWRVLRVLGNLLELDGFDYMEPADVTQELEGLLAGKAPADATFPVPERAGADADGLVRVGDVPPYAVDAVVRRSGPLQSSVLGGAPVVRVNPAVAQRLGVEDGERVSVAQGEGRVTMPLAVDARVADEAVVVPAGNRETAVLGAAYGPVSVEKL